uniref:Uncharacterized protein n=1 Tax=Arundo donax TaxID=35708 RepID=A0A0A9HUA9_ARUDO
MYFANTFLGASRMLQRALVFVQRL